MTSLDQGTSTDEPAPAAKPPALARFLARAGLLLPTVGLLAVFAFSVVQMARLSLSDDDGFSVRYYTEFFSRPDYIDIYLRTMWVSVVVTLICILVGYPIAYGIWRYRGNRNYLLVAVIAPWLVSIVVRTYGWMVILSPRGLVNELLLSAGLLDIPARLMFNATGVIIGLVHIFTPFMVVVVLSVLLELDRTLEEAGMSLGAGPLRTFFRVTLPLSMQGVTSGATLVYLTASGAIVTPVLLGGLRDRMIGTQIYQEVMQTFNFPKAATLAVLLLIGGLIVILPLQLLERRLAYKISESGSA